MKSTAASSPPRPTTDTLRRYAEALPTLQRSQPLDERTAQAVRSVLEQTDPQWGERLKAQIDAIVREVAAHLDIDGVSGRYAITDVELRGIIARAVSRAGGQIAVDIGRALAQAPPGIRFADDPRNEQGGDTDENGSLNNERPELQEGD